MSELLDRLRERGDWRMTSQRRVVAEVLAGEHVHLTAEQVLARARRVLPEISQATIYNVLGDLVALGEVREVSVDDGARRYDPNVAEPHQHLLCTTCGDLRDVHPDHVPSLSDPERHGFTIDSVEVTFLGRCTACHTG